MHNSSDLGHTSNSSISQLSQVGIVDSVEQTEYFRSQVFDLLDGEGQIEVNNFNNTFDELIKQLNRLIQLIRWDFNYTYHDIDDYSKRISKSDKFLENVFQIILQENKKLRKIYNSIVQLVSCLPNSDLIKKQLYNEYFYDLVIESLRPSYSKESGEGDNDCYDLPMCYEFFVKIKSLHLIFNNCEQSFGPKQLFQSDFANKLYQAKQIQLGATDFSSVDISFVDKFFSFDNNIKIWDFVSCNLGTTDIDILKLIFSNLNSAKVIGMRYNKLRKSDVNCLNIIFSNINQIRFIDLDHNDIGNMNHEQLDIIFSNLKNARSVSLEYNDLELLDNNAFDIIFSNLRRARYISLQGNSFSSEQKKYLKTKYCITKFND